MLSFLLEVQWPRHPPGFTPHQQYTLHLLSPFPRDSTLSIAIRLCHSVWALIQAASTLPALPKAAKAPTCLSCSPSSRLAHGAAAQSLHAPSPLPPAPPASAPVPALQPHHPHPQAYLLPQGAFQVPQHRTHRPPLCAQSWRPSRGLQGPSSQGPGQSRLAH